jgi:hypothetical protein
MTGRSKKIPCFVNCFFTFHKLWSSHKLSTLHLKFLFAWSMNVGRVYLVPSFKSASGICLCTLAKFVVDERWGAPLRRILLWAKLIEKRELRSTDVHFRQRSMTGQQLLQVQLESDVLRRRCQCFFLLSSPWCISMVWNSECVLYLGYFSIKRVLMPGRVFF